MAENIYRFPYGVNSDETPKIQARMTPEEYANYKENLQKMDKGLKRGSVATIRELSSMAPVYVPINGLNLVRQTCTEFKNIPYPVPSDPARTVASHGAFQIILHNVLRYFGKSVSVENLTKFANFGDWHDKNGTWHHFIDVICKAYGLDTVRLGSWSYVYRAINDGNLIVALLDHKMFPEGYGNSLVLITGIEKGDIIFYHPRFGDDLCRCEIAHFMLNTKVLWRIAD